MSAMSAEPSGRDGAMTIGEVLSLLRPDFKDVTISKIRFLEGEGLIAPQRAPSGYRRFSADDVARLRLVLTAQRDHYLPLRVIKERLEAGDLRSFLEPPAAEPPAEPELEVEVEPEADPEPRSADIDPHQMFSRRELAAESGLPLDGVKQLESFGVIQADPAGRFSGSHVLVCRAYAVLRRHGVEERHLRQVKNAATRDASLIDQSVVHLQSQERSAAQAQMLQSFSDAHYWLVMCELNRSAPPSSHHPRRVGR